MMFGLMRVRTHDAEMAKVRGERDQANTDKRTVGAALREALGERDTLQLRFHQALREVTAERDTLQARLDALTPARGQGGRFARRGTAADVNPHQCFTTALPTPPETTA